LLPLMASEKLAGDTLWFVAEADFTFHESDDCSRRSFFSEAHWKDVWLNRLAAMKEGMTEEASKAFDDFTTECFMDEDGPKVLQGVPRWRHWGEASASAPHVQMADPRWKQEYYEFKVGENAGPGPSGTRGVEYIRSTRAGDERARGNVTEELRDLLSLCNCAQRHGRGGWTWLSWNAAHWSDKTSRTTVPCTGGQLSGVTTDAARWLLERFRNVHPQHTGTWMANVILQEWQLLLGAAYVSPPVGHYFQHVSSWDKTQRPLPTHWHQKWVQSGTRPMKSGDTHRFICSWLPSGPREIICEVDVTQDAHRFWLTQCPPAFPPAFVGLQWYHTNAEDLLFFNIAERCKTNKNLCNFNKQTQKQKHPKRKPIKKDS
jgi:hypothetical protein